MLLSELDSSAFIKPHALTPGLKIPQKIKTTNSFIGVPSEDGSPDKECSILDVNNDQMFDDTVFTEYDEQNISTMTKKISKYWRKKIKDEDKEEAKRKVDDLSLEELVQRQTEKGNVEAPNITNEEMNFSPHVTNNRNRRAKQANNTKSNFRLSSSDISKN